MASDRWLSIKVELLSGRGLELDRPPGRVMIASPKHTLAGGYVGAAGEPSWQVREHGLSRRSAARASSP